MAHNPYIVGNVIKDEHSFVGRGEIVQEIINALKDFKQIVMLHGQRRVGKSSILSQVEKEISKTDLSLIPVSIDLQGRLEKSLEQLVILLAKTINKSCNLSKTITYLQRDPNPAQSYRYLAAGSSCSLGGT